MAVFTPVSDAEVAALLAELDVGTLTRLQGIPAGIENSNFFVTTTGRGVGDAASDTDWVLTLFERLTPQQLPFYLGLMQHLARHGLPVPAPCATRSGRLLHQVAGKPAALVQRLPGAHLMAPDLHHCAQLGQVLARMHLAVADFPLRQANLRGLDWCVAGAPALLPHLGPAQRALLEDELAFQHQVAASAEHARLPQGAVHADLFRDNALFDGLPGHERLTGAIDFYFAGIDSFAYDLAVCLNDWCLAADGMQLDPARAEALVAAYQGERPLQGAEQRLLPAMLRRAALRFWVSRLADWHGPRDAHLLQPKDPAHFERLLTARRETPWHPPV